MSRYRLRPVLPSERAMVFDWRNDPRVRQVMSNRNIVDQEVHKGWWPSALADPTRRMLILADGALPVALLMFFEVQPGVRATWGFYAASRHESPAESLSTWITVEVAAIAYAFDHLRLETLYCETLESNSAVLLLHDRVGFRDTGQVQGGFVQKSITRADYELRRTGPLFAQLSEVAIEADHRELRGAVATALPPLERGAGLRAAILGSANWELAAHDLSETHRNAVGGRLEVSVPPFGQYVLDLADASSPLRQDPPDILIFAERFEDLAGVDQLDTYLEAIRSARAVMPARILINDFAPVRPRPQSIAEALDSLDATARLAATFNRRLHALADMADTQLIPLADQVLETGRRNSDPGKYWFLGRIPYGQALVDRWTSCVAGIIAADDGRTIRAIVCDLDDTLWADSAGGDWPGDAFLAVQRCLKLFHERGILLAICSKNEEAAAHEMLRAPGMILQAGDFAARRINWSPKAENITSIAGELGLSESSIMFLDNDPLERAEIRETLPRVVTPELPWDVADWPRFLVNHPLLTQLAVWPEDTSRQNAYRVKQIIETAGPERTRESVLRSLGLAIEWKPVDNSTLGRAVQLAAKTNQFHTSGIRYREADLQGAKAWTVRLLDRFGGDDVAGLAVMRFDDARNAAVIETILLSCRILGRGVETAVLALLNEAAADRGCAWLEGGIVETERNQPCRNLYRTHGFAEVSPGRFVRDLSRIAIERPSWFTYL